MSGNFYTSDICASDALPVLDLQCESVSMCDSLLSQCQNFFRRRHSELSEDPKGVFFFLEFFFLMC